MLDIRIDDNELKKSTENYFNVFYMNLLFSDTDTMEMEFNTSTLNEDKIILVAEKTVSSVDVYDELRSRAKRSRFKTNSVVENTYLDYDYLMELGNSNGLELKYQSSKEDGSEIRYELSWADKNKFTKVKIPKRDRIY